MVRSFDFGEAENHVRELFNDLVGFNQQVILVTQNGLPLTQVSFYNQPTLYFEKRDEFLNNAKILEQNIRNDFSISKTTAKTLNVYSGIST